MIVNTENLHTVKWLIDHTGKPTTTIYAWLNSGRIPHFKVDGLTLVNELDFPDWLRALLNKKIV